MKARRIKFFALALAGLLVAPSAMAHRSHHDQNRIGVVIHLGSSFGGLVQTAKPLHRPKHHSKSYHHGYRDGYKHGKHSAKKGPHHKHKHKAKHRAPTRVQVLPPGHYRPAPGHKVHFHR